MTILQLGGDYRDYFTLYTL